jgi:hypothetical protein
MHPIFFVWRGSYDELVATRFYSGVKRTRAVQIASDRYLGLVEAESSSHRNHLANLHADFTLLPGLNGTLSAAQANALNAALPQLEFKEGGSHKAALECAAKLSNDAAFDPNSY